MKFAIIDDQKVEATPNQSGNCPGCGSTVISKCGTKNVWHWAHRGTRMCDPWWENETEWHRNWKSHFPVPWQEVHHTDDNGERHIADVKTLSNWVIEFQHSAIDPSERQSRNEFYKKIVWVVDGTRRKRDAKQFVNALNGGLQFNSNRILRGLHKSESKLVEEWSDSNVYIFFDFGGESDLWCLHPRTSGDLAWVVPIQKKGFIGIHLGFGQEKSYDFSALIQDINKNVLTSVTQWENRMRRGPTINQIPSGFQKHMARRLRARSRMRF